MATLLEIVTAMETKLQPIVSASDFEVQLSHLRVIKPSPPCIDIYPFDPFTENEAASFGSDDSETIWTVRARISASDPDAAQEFLLRLMDTEDALSVVGNLQADQTLGGVAGSVEVEGPTGHRIYEDITQQGAYIGVEWKATVVRAEPLS